MIVADASPLIVLARLQRLGLLKDLYGEVLIGPVVKAEAIDAGKKIRANGVEQLDAALASGWLRMVSLTAQEHGLRQGLAGRSRLDRGEAEAIALASGRGLRLIVDDKEARSVAAASGVPHLGTAGALLEAYLKRCLDMRELETTVRDLGQILWLSPAVVAEILRLARETDR